MWQHTERTPSFRSSSPPSGRRCTLIVLDMGQGTGLRGQSRLGKHAHGTPQQMLAGTRALLWPLLLKL